MKKLFLLLILSFFSAQGFAGSCPDGSDPVKSVSADGTYFVYNCGGDSNNAKDTKTSNKASTNSSNILEGSVKASDINFPGNFYTTEIESCKAMAGTPTFNSNSSIEFVEGLIGYDWHADWEANSNSMNVYHKKITGPIKIFMSATHNAIGNNNQANINIAKNLLIDLAKVDTLYDSIGYIDVKKKPMCYAGGDINSPCWYHEYQFASNVFSNYMITALWLKDELNEQEFKIVDKYIKKMYKKFLKPIEFHKEEQGFYAMANGGTSILVYASWTNNKKLVAEEINHRFQEMDRLFYEDGYINNNSFRGYRGQWYHSYGLDIALGYVYIADLWGAEVPEKLHNKLVKASKVANLAITDSHVVILVLDAHEGVTDQDATLLGMIAEKGRALLIVINKWDGLDNYQKSEVKRKLDVKLSFVNYASVHYISALHGSGVGKLFTPIKKSFEHAGGRFTTSLLNKILEKANDAHQAPPVAGKRPRLKFVNQSDVFPPTFIFHGNHVNNIPNSYERFLKNFFITSLKLSNTPIKIEYKSGDNPFKDKKNKLSARQVQKRKRLMKFVKKK